MPFKSEAQRRYLWANEPEIARDWADTYGSRIQAAHGGGIMQGGVKNYLGKQKEVTAPVKWQSSPDHPTTELAYITEAEKDLLVKQDLHNSLKGGVNRGPSGIMSLNGWGSKDSSGNEVGMSGAATSDAEAGRNTANTRAESPTPSGPALPPGVTPNIDPALQGYRDAFINAGGGQRVNPGFFDSRTHLSPNEIASAKAYRNDPNNLFAKQAYRNTGQSGIGNFLSGGGFFGNLIRGLGQKVGLGGIDPALLENYSDAKIQKNSFLQDDQVSGVEETINEDGDTYEEAISKGTFDGEKFQFESVYKEGLSI